MMEELNQVGVFGLAALAVIVLYFVVNFVRSPAKMDNEARSERADLLLRLQKLEDERVPKIAALAYPGLRESGIGHHLMWAELDVKNTSPVQSLLNTQVRIIACETLEVSEDDSSVFKNLGNVLWERWSPISIRWLNSGSCVADIPGGVSRTAIVAFSEDSNGPPAVFNDVAFTRCVGAMKITVEVSSPSSAPYFQSYFIQCHPNYALGPSAHFEFLPWNEWELSHKVIERVPTELMFDKVDSQTEEVE
jgi:hypothetical protein